MNETDTSYLPNMLLIGASGRNAGKTEFSCRVISRFAAQDGIVAAKVTAIDKADGVCPRGGKGCGVCTSLEGIFDIREETHSAGSKDTSRLLSAGANKVFWMRVLKSHMQEGMAALQEIIGKDVLWLCESNSIRNAVRPGVFLMVEELSGKYKASAETVAHFADLKIKSQPDLDSFDFDFSRLSVERNRWALRENAAAIILAGGKSSRMGSNKSLLQINGRTMIEHIADQVVPHFASTIISAADSAEYEFLGLHVVSDPEKGCGPLMGIFAALSQSQCELNFVTACDAPDINMPLVRRMISLASENGSDVVVPRFSDGRIEPLYGAFRRTVLPELEKLLKSGERKVRALFNSCETLYYDIGEEDEIVNLNTKADFEAYSAGSLRR